MLLRMYNPYAEKAIEVKEDEIYYENELQKVYDQEIDFIIFTDVKTNRSITVRPNNWAMIEVEKWNINQTNLIIS